MFCHVDVKKHENMLQAVLFHSVLLFSKLHLDLTQLQLHMEKSKWNPKKQRDLIWYAQPWCQFSELNFRKFLVTSGKAFFDISGKEGNLARYTRIFRNYQPGTSVPFVFLLRILRNFRLNDSLFRNTTILRFFGNFLMKFPNQISLISEFLEFWLNEKCPHIKWMNSACIFMYIYTCIS